MIDPVMLKELEIRMDRAEARYGPFASTHEALGVALEEWTELVTAIQGNKLDSIEWEALDLAAVLIRLAFEARSSNAAFAERSVK